MKWIAETIRLFVHGLEMGKWTKAEKPSTEQKRFVVVQ
jgi:hypothetical protein